MGTAQTQSEQVMIGAKQFAESAAYLLRETFVGSPEGQPSAYLDRGIGLFVTLDALSAEAASSEFHGTTIAAQTEHAKFYLDRICEFVNGRTEAVNWEDSWLIETVNDAEWGALSRAMGLRNLFVPQSRVQHEGGATIRRFYDAAEVSRIDERNRVQFQLRCIPGGDTPAVRERLRNAPWRTLAEMLHPSRMWSLARLRASLLGDFFAR